MSSPYAALVNIAINTCTLASMHAVFVGALYSQRASRVFLVRNAKRQVPDVALMCRYAYYTWSWKRYSKICMLEECHPNQLFCSLLFRRTVQPVVLVALARNAFFSHLAELTIMNHIRDPFWTGHNRPEESSLTPSAFVSTLNIDPSLVKLDLMHC